jgi:hypothetical protein
MRAVKLALLALLALLVSTSAWAQGIQGAPLWPGVTLPTFVIPASAVNGGGTVTSPQLLAPDGSASAPSYSFASQANKGLFSPASNRLGIAAAGGQVIDIDGGAGRVILEGTYLFGWGSPGVTSPDLLLAREGADHWFQRRTTNAQRASWANTYTSATNYEAFSIDWQTTASVALVGTRTAATGTGRRLSVVAQGSTGANVFGALSLTGVSSPLARIGYYDSSLTPQTGSFTELVRLGEHTNNSTSGTVAIVTVTPTYNQTSGTAANEDLVVDRTQTAVGSGVQRLLALKVGSVTKHYVTADGTAKGTQEGFTQATAPTCTSANNCGTGNGTFATGSSDTAGSVTLGTTPASGFIITFTGTWPTAPVCNVWMNKAGMAVGKTVLTSVTTTGQITVVTNGVAPSTGDIYAYRCTGLQ